MQQAPLLPAALAVTDRLVHAQVLHNTYPSKETLWDHYKRLKYIPFNPVDKFTMAVVEDTDTGKVRQGCLLHQEASYGLNCTWFQQPSLKRAAMWAELPPCGRGSPQVWC